MSTTATILNDQQRQQYESDGYTLVRNLIPADMMDAIRDQLLRIEAGECDWPERHFQVSQTIKTPAGTPLPIGVQLPSVCSDTFRNVADHPRLQSAMAELLGGAVTRSTDQALIKSRYIPSGHRGQTFYHQDSYYWRIAPHLGCNAWIAVDEVGPGAIALGIMPGTHKDWKIEEHEAYFDDPPLCRPGSDEPFKRFRIPRDRIDFSKEVVLEMKPGDAAFFSNFTWHRAEPNTTSSTRSAYAVAYKRDVESERIEVPKALDAQE